MGEDQIQSPFFFIDGRKSAAAENREYSHDQGHIGKKPHGQVFGRMRDSVQIAAHRGEKELEVLGHLLDFLLLLLHDVIGENHRPGYQEQAQAPDEDGSG